MASTGSYKSRVAENVKWIKKVMGDRLAEEDELVIQQTAQQMIVEEDLFKQVEKLNGNFIHTTSKGVESASPVFRLWLETSSKLQTTSRLLGLSPIARKEKLNSPAKATDAANDFEEAVNEL